MKRLVWCIKQLLPLMYVSEYREDGYRRLTIWRMWMGRCFNVRDYGIVP